MMLRNCFAIVVQSTQRQLSAVGCNCFWLLCIYSFMLHSWWFLCGTSLHTSGHITIFVLASALAPRCRQYGNERFLQGWLKASARFCIIVRKWRRFELLWPCRMLIVQMIRSVCSGLAGWVLPHRGVTASLASTGRQGALGGSATVVYVLVNLRAYCTPHLVLLSVICSSYRMPSAWT